MILQLRQTSWKLSMDEFNYKMTICYDGTKYAGWQFQLNALSIQEVIQNTLSAILPEKITIHGSGRTDTGVHALKQTAHFKTAHNLEKRRFLFSMNSLLPDDIRIMDIEKVSNDFHARYSATGKTYYYHIHLDPVLCPFNDKYRWHMHQPIDLEKLKEAALYFLGTHDFASFANESHKGAAAKDAVRTIKRIDLIMQDGGFRLEFEGDGFLYKMVRNLTGFLVDVGRGRKNISDIAPLMAAKDRRKLGKTAPAQGLFLVEVHY